MRKMLKTTKQCPYSLKTLKTVAVLGMGFGLSLLSVSPRVLADLSLKEHFAVTDEMIRFKDIFDGAGDKENSLITTAPAPGERLQISLYELERAVKAANLVWDKPSSLKNISITRDGIPLSDAMLSELIKNAALNEGASPDSEIQLYGNIKNIYLPTHYDPSQLYIEQMTLSNNGGRFLATLNLPTGEKSSEKLNLHGKIEEMRLMPVLNRSVTPGELIEAQDVEWKNFPANRIAARALQSEQRLVGYTVRRSLRPGLLLREDDILKPIAVEKGSYVSMNVIIGTMQLAASGRAMESGGVGDVIRLVNPQTNLHVEGTITGAGRVEIRPAHALIAAR